MIMWQYCLMLLISLFDLFTTVLSTAYGYIYIYLIFLQEAAKKRLMEIFSVFWQLIV